VVANARGDTLYGRGSADMKGGLAAALIAIEALDSLGIELGGDLLFESTIEGGRRWRRWSVVGP